MDAAAKREIMLPPLPGENNYPWEGGVNGTFYRIKRGVKVSVPENVARLIEQSEELREKSRLDTAAYTRGMGKRLG
jgi:cytochrome c